MKLPFVKQARRILRNTFGLEVGYAKYYPHSTDLKIFQHYLGSLPVRIIFDVGANIGQTTSAFRASFPAATIHSFEPFQRNFFELGKIASRDTKIHPHKMALSDTEGNIDVLTDDMPQSEWNSLSQIKQQELKNSGATRSETIQTARGDKLCERLHIVQIDILKIDTEGFDFEVLQGFEGLFKSGSINCVLVEVGFYGDRGHGDFQKINGLMGSHSMRLAGFYEICHFENGKCEFANALFINSQL